MLFFIAEPASHHLAWAACLDSTNESRPLILADITKLDVVRSVVPPKETAKHSESINIV